MGALDINGNTAAVVADRIKNTYWGDRPALAKERFLAIVEYAQRCPAGPDFLFEVAEACGLTFYDAGLTVQGRMPGWYWTHSTNDGWEPARYSEKGWEPAMSASTGYFDDDAMGPIGPRIPEPVSLLAEREKGGAK